MDFREYMEKTGAQIIGAFVGAVIPIALAEKMSIARAGVLLMVGVATSFYLAPLICYFFSLSDNEIRSSVGFLVGLTGVQLTQAILKYFTAERFRAILDRMAGHKKE